MDLGLHGRVAIVGGATSGLGLAVAEALSAEGATVVMVGRRHDVLSGHAERLGAHAFVADLADHAARAELVEFATTRFGGLDILVWNTGGPATGSATEITPDRAQQAFDDLFVPLIDLVALALPHLRRSDQGRILAITTGGVKEPTDIALSNAIRPGIVGYLKSLSTELGPDGITVNNLAPGRIRTPRLERVYLDGPPADLESEIPLARFGTPDDIGAAACFLASAPAGYITGVTLNVDGGLAKAIF